MSFDLDINSFKVIANDSNNVNYINHKNSILQKGVKINYHQGWKVKHKIWIPCMQCMLLPFLIQSPIYLQSQLQTSFTLRMPHSSHKAWGWHVYRYTFTGDFLLLAQKLMTICGENFTQIMRKWKMKVRFKIKQIMDGQN